MLLSLLICDENRLLFNLDNINAGPNGVQTTVEDVRQCSQSERNGKRLHTSQTPQFRPKKRKNEIYKQFGGFWRDEESCLDVISGSGDFDVSICSA